MFKAGKYWIGDPCYVNFEGYTWQHGTAYGDGVFVDQKGREYGVDGGSLGIVAIEYVGKEADGGHFIEFKKDFKCSYAKGVFHFGHVRIDTNI